MYFSPRDPCSELGGEPVSASGARPWKNREFDGFQTVRGVHVCLEQMGLS